MKRLSVLIGLLLCCPSVRAELSLQQVRTASNNVLVAYFKSTIVQADEVNTSDVSPWKLNGQPVLGINRFVTEADACDHHIYLQVPPLVNGNRIPDIIDEAEWGAMFWEYMQEPSGAIHWGTEQK